MFVKKEKNILELIQKYFDKHLNINKEFCFCNSWLLFKDCLFNNKSDCYIHYLVNIKYNKILHLDSLSYKLFNNKKINIYDINNRLNDNSLYNLLTTNEWLNNSINIMSNILIKTLSPHIKTWEQYNNDKCINFYYKKKWKAKDQQCNNLKPINSHIISNSDLNELSKKNDLLDISKYDFDILKQKLVLKNENIILNNKNLSIPCYCHECDNNYLDIDSGNVFSNNIINLSFDLLYLWIERFLWYYFYNILLNKYILELLIYLENEDIILLQKLRGINFSKMPNSEILELIFNQKLINNFNKNYYTNKKFKLNYGNKWSKNIKISWYFSLPLELIINKRKNKNIKKEYFIWIFTIENSNIIFNFLLEKKYEKYFNIQTINKNNLIYALEYYIKENFKYPHIIIYTNKKNDWYYNINDLLGNFYNIKKNKKRSENSIFKEKLKIFQNFIKENI